MPPCIYLKMSKFLTTLKKHKPLCTRAKTFSMLFGYYGDPVTHLHNNVQHHLQPNSILYYTKPLLKLCAFLASREQSWTFSEDVIAPLSKGKADETALKFNISQRVQNANLVERLRNETADIALEIANVLGNTPESRVLVNLTTLFLSVLDGDCRISVRTTHCSICALLNGVHYILVLTLHGAFIILCLCLQAVLRDNLICDAANLLDQ